MELNKLQSLIESMDYGLKNAENLKTEKTRGIFVTISREAGAGGHSIADALVEAMKGRSTEPLFQDWQIVDHEICQAVIEKFGYKFCLDQMASKEYQSQIEDMAHELVLGNVSQDAVVKKMFETIRILAGLGKVIIIGRGGACVTRSLKSGIHIRLVAPLSFKVERVCGRFNLNEKEAKKYITEQDKSREKLVKTFFNQDIRDPLLYDMVINTGRLSEKEVAYAVLSLISQKKSILT